MCTPFSVPISSSLIASPQRAAHAAHCSEVLCELWVLLGDLSILSVYVSVSLQVRPYLELCPGSLSIAESIDDFAFCP